MKLPIFCIIGTRPVKAVGTDDGGMDILAFDWKTGEFSRAMDYLTRIMMPDAEVDVVTEKEFESAVANLRKNLNR